MRRTLAAAGLAAAGALAGCLTGCSAETGPRAAVQADPSSAGPAAPAATAGPLTAEDLPPAGALGPGWATAVDDGDAEGGYVGNGTPTLARDPHDVVALAVPLGCARRSDLPVPQHALEQTYAETSSGAAGVAVRLRFADAATAMRFHADRLADLRACAAQPVSAALGGAALVRDVSAPDAVTVRSVRVDPWADAAVASWVETATLDGTDVVLVAVQGGTGTD